MIDETAVSGSRLVTADLDANTRIGKYRLVRPLGSGGMGVVWAAHDPDLDREVALKLLRDRGDGSRVRLMREGRAMAKLKHPNVLTVYEVGSTDGRDFIAMELVDGDSLEGWFGSKPSRAEVITALLAAGHGLAAAHAAGVVHRDFKPHNVLRSRDGRVMVTDFGLARGIDDAAPISVPPVDTTSAENVRAAAISDTLAAPEAKLTRTGTIVGTPAYMAPEQFAGGLPNTRTDQFAFCVAAWQGLTGKRPFHGATFEALANATEQGVQDIEADLPRKLRVVLERGLDPDPDKRYPSMDALLAAFARAARPPRRGLPIAIAGFVAVAAGAAYVLTRSSSSLPALCDDHAIPGLADSARWNTAVNDACRLEPEPRDVQIACLENSREQIAIELEVAKQDGPGPFPPDLPLSPCAVSPAPLPDDPAARQKIRDVRIAAAKLRRGHYDAAAVSTLLGRAGMLDRREMLLEVQLIAALVAERDEQFTAARDMYDAVVASAAVVRDPRRDAIAKLGLVRLTAVQLLHPNDPDEFDRVASVARKAFQQVDDPSLPAALELVSGDLDLGQGRYDDAIRKLDEARVQLERAGDVVGTRTAAWLAIEALLDRSHPGDLDRASSMMPGLYGPNEVNREREVRAIWLGLEIARRRGDRVATRKLANTLVAMAKHEDEMRGNLEAALAAEPGVVLDDPSAPPGPPLHGTVVDANGAPVGARILTWDRDLGGDASEADAWGGVVAFTSADGGKFTLASSAWVIAEAYGARSAPQPFKDNVVLTLTKPQTISGTITFDEDRPSLMVRARVALKQDNAERVVASWQAHANVGDDGRFELANLPDVPVEVFASARIGRDAVRVKQLDVAKPDWDQGLPYEIIVRKYTTRPRKVWALLDYGTHAFTGDQFFAKTDTAPDRIIGLATPIGARDLTPALRTLYQPGDYHFAFRGSERVLDMCILEEGGGVGCMPAFNAELVNGVVVLMVK